MALLLQFQNQQEMLVAQCSVTQNEFICRAKRRRTGLRKARAYWKKQGRTGRWWINLWQGHLMEEEWSANLRMTRPLFMKLLEERRPYISRDPKSPNRTALSTEKKASFDSVLSKRYGIFEYDS